MLLNQSMLVELWPNDKMVSIREHLGGKVKDD